MKYMLLIHQGDTPTPARAERLRRLERHAEARDAYRRALGLVHNEAERRLLDRRLADLPG